MPLVVACSRWDSPELLPVDRLNACFGALVLVLFVGGRAQLSNSQRWTMDQGPVGGTWTAACVYIFLVLAICVGTLRFHDSQSSLQHQCDAGAAADEAAVEQTQSATSSVHTILEPTQCEISQVAAERDSLSRTLQRLRDQLHEVMLERDAFREAVREWTEASPGEIYRSSASVSGDCGGRVNPPPLPPESEAVALLRRRGGSVKPEKWV